MALVPPPGGQGTSRTFIVLLVNSNFTRNSCSTILMNFKSCVLQAFVSFHEFEYDRNKC